jgi:predicted nuclease of predicted toxin-antitoxin system
MSLRLLADQCVPAEIIDALQRHGYDTVLVRDVISPRSPDPVVLAKAQELDCILLSLNGDFSDIVTYLPSRYRGIIAVQLHNHPEVIPALMTRLVSYLQAHPDPADYTGKLLIVEPHRIRIRR